MSSDGSTSSTSGAVGSSFLSLSTLDLGQQQPSQHGNPAAGPSGVENDADASRTEPNKLLRLGEQLANCQVSEFDQIHYFVYYSLSQPRLRVSRNKENKLGTVK